MKEMKFTKCFILEGLKKQHNGSIPFDIHIEHLKTCPICIKNMEKGFIAIARAYQSKDTSLDTAKNNFEPSP